MLPMYFLILRVDQDVINEYHEKLAQIRHEHRIPQVHEMCRSTSESKQHNQILIQLIPVRECSFRDVF
jgi:hypothetical protein